MGSLVLGDDQAPARQRLPCRDAHHVRDGETGERLPHGQRPGRSGRRLCVRDLSRRVVTLGNWCLGFAGRARKAWGYPRPVTSFGISVTSPPWRRGVLIGGWARPGQHGAPTRSWHRPAAGVAGPSPGGASGIWYSAVPGPRPARLALVLRRIRATAVLSSATSAVN